MPTKIPYADEGWPVVTGCSHAHTGCDTCYAARLAATRLKHRPQYKGLAKKENGKYRWTGEVRLNSDILEKPFHWKKPRKVFVAQTGDLFHEEVPSKFIFRVWDVMERAKQHTFLVFTKRPSRMVDVLGGTSGAGLSAPPLPNVRLYTSISDQATADKNIPHLLRCPGAVLGLSLEPMLGPIEFKGTWDEELMYCRQCGYVAEKNEPFEEDGGPSDEPWAVCPKCGGTNSGGYASYTAMDIVMYDDRPFPPLDHVIIGCESGPGRRPCKLEWIESAVEQCQAAGVPAYVKQIPQNGKVCSDVMLFPKHLQLRETPKGA